MADSDTGMLLFGLAVLVALGLLYWKASSSGTVKITEFIRDKDGKVIQIIEK